MKEKIMKRIKVPKKELVIFASSFFFLLTLGIALSYNFNLLFDSDTARVIGDLINPLADHSRLDVHPLLVLLMQPICLFVKGIVQNKMLSIILVSSLCSSISILFIYKIMKLVSKDEKINTLIPIMYGLSFSNIIFTAGIETYNFATLFLIILFYIFIKSLKEKELDKNKCIILIL